MSQFKIHFLRIYVFIGAVLFCSTSFSQYIDYSYPYTIQVGREVTFPVTGFRDISYGGQTLTVTTSLSGSSAFSLPNPPLSDDCAGPRFPNQYSCQVYIRFKPLTPGIHTVLALVTDTVDNPQYGVSSSVIQVTVNATASPNECITQLLTCRDPVFPNFSSAVEIHEFDPSYALGIYNLCCLNANSTTVSCRVTDTRQCSGNPTPTPTPGPTPTPPPIYSLSIQLSNPSVNPAGTGGNSITSVNAQLSSNTPGVSLSGQTILFTELGIDGTGGHVHATPLRPSGEFSSGSCVTNASGKCSTEYAATEVSGTETITGVLSGSLTARSSAVLSVGVPGLIRVSPAYFYRLTGNENTPWHPSNHYMSPGSTRIFEMAKDFYDLYDATMGLNDMSLELGGVFDLDQNWSRPHVFHRVGKSFDVDECAVSIIPNNPNPTIPKCGPNGVVIQGDLFKNLCKLHRGRKEIETPLHCELK